MRKLVYNGGISNFQLLLLIKCMIDVAQVLQVLATWYDPPYHRNLLHVNYLFSFLGYPLVAMLQEHLRFLKFIAISSSGHLLPFRKRLHSPQVGISCDAVNLGQEHKWSKESG